MRSRFCCALLALAAAVVWPAFVLAKPRPHLRDPYPRAAVAYAVTIDGHLLWGQRLDQRRAPASLTKLLTALVVLNTDWNPRAMLPVSRRAAYITRVRAGLRAGDHVRAEDALTAMLVHSANDACMVLAQHVGHGSIRAFARLMNEEARRIGMRESHFVQPCGLDARGQYSTVRDLLRLARAARSNPRIARVTGREQGRIVTAEGRVIRFRSTNRLLGRLYGVVGMKTGFTAHAGPCLIAIADRAGHQVWLVMLDSRRRWGYAHRMINAAFSVTGRVSPRRRYDAGVVSLQRPE